MQPYLGSPAALVNEADLARRRVDWRNCGLILAGWAAILTLIPWQHEYPIIDDWVYAGAVRHQLATGRFDIPPQSETSLLGLVAWGAGWSRLLGFSFTVLTASTLVLALAALLAFYGIARSTSVPSAGALLGTALLAINPLFLDLSYSFMSDVPFLALTLVACLCYLYGLRSDRLGWIVAGGLLASWAFLIRQLGLFIPVSVLAYLLFEGLVTHKWRWRAMVATLAGAAPVLAVWYVATRGVPPNAAATTASARAAAFLFKESWLHVIMLRLLTALPLLGLLLPVAAVIPRARRWLIGGVAIATVWGLYAVDFPIGQWNGLTEPPLAAQLGPLSVTLPQEAYPFARIGNIIRVDGIDFFQYTQQAIWTPWVWGALWVLGIFLGVVLATALVSRIYDALQAIRRHKPRGAYLALYLLGGLILAATFALAGDFYDRYLLAAFPFAVLFAVRGSAGWSRAAWIGSLAGLALLTSWSLALKADQIAHDNARWQAGHWLLVYAGPPQVGYDWDNWVAAGDPAYHVTDVHVEGFRVERRFPYVSLLSGLTTREVLAEVRADLPPLAPRPPGAP